ncbi:MAG: ABC transporter ATP-binding protein [Acidobacteria bacterium]|nr:ABC transporter ATP-binding protein [Acidobacteriota bacterium]
MDVGIRIDNLRKVFTSPPPTAALARGGPMGGQRMFKRPEKKTFEVVALDGVSLEVRPGEIFGLLGPNGAGKSTTVGILTTRVRPTSGQAWIGGHEVWHDRVAVKRLIGVVPQKPNLDFALTAREILTYHAAYFGMPGADRHARATELLDRFKLTDRADQMVHGFSGGMMQRLSIARALMHGPQILFLDEPSTGLDPQTRLLLWELIRDFNRRGHTVMLTTHNMEEADALCDRLAIVDHGRVIAVGSPDELKRSVPGGYVVRLTFDRVSEELKPLLAQIPGVTEVQAPPDGGLDLYADRGGTLIPHIVSAAGSAGATIHDIHISEPSLENLFLHHTGRSLRE